jgi:hypothetical protein
MSRCEKTCGSHFSTLSTLFHRSVTTATPADTAQRQMARGGTIRMADPAFGGLASYFRRIDL